MLVKHRHSGKLGTIPDDKFDPALFDKVDQGSVVPQQNVAPPAPQTPAAPQQNTNNNYQPVTQTPPEKSWAENFFDAATAPIQHYGHLLGGFLEPTVTKATNGAVQLPKLTPEEDKRLQNPWEGAKEIATQLLRAKL